MIRVRVESEIEVLEAVERLFQDFWKENGDCFVTEKVETGVRFVTAPGPGAVILVESEDISPEFILSAYIVRKLGIFDKEMEVRELIQVCDAVADFLKDFNRGDE